VVKQAKVNFNTKAMKHFKDWVIFPGKKYKFIHTMNITVDHLRSIFIPLTFSEKYAYLGSVPGYSKNQEMTMLKALVVAMDYHAKPWWCPRWFLRFLNLFGSDNSIVRVRNRSLHNLHRKLTKGILMWDYKTKWTDYDLRISISAPEYLQDLADAIEQKTYSKGRQEEIANEILSLDPNAFVIRGNTSTLVKQLNELKKSLNLETDDEF
jgi:hypothetical protein